QKLKKWDSELKAKENEFSDREKENRRLEDYLRKTEARNNELEHTIRTLQRRIDILEHGSKGTKISESTNSIHVHPPNTRLNAEEPGTVELICGIHDKVTQFIMNKVSQQITRLENLDDTINAQLNAGGSQTQVSGQTCAQLPLSQPSEADNTSEMYTAVHIPQSPVFNLNNGPSSQLYTPTEDYRNPSNVVDYQSNVCSPIQPIINYENVSTLWTPAHDVHFIEACATTPITQPAIPITVPHPHIPTQEILNPATEYETRIDSNGPVHVTNSATAVHTSSNMLSPKRSLSPYQRFMKDPVTQIITYGYNMYPGVPNNNIPISTYNDNKHPTHLSDVTCATGQSLYYTHPSTTTDSQHFLYQTVPQNRVI
ncbi:MAG: hypothetical protein ABW185_26870, partial [Sedimenticola sp.]